MTWQSVAAVLAVLALIADCLVLAALIGWLLSRLSSRLHDTWESARDLITPYALPAAFVVGVMATGGSLYFQYGAGFDPCTMCWFQRICMYPQALLLGIAAFRGDLYTARRYAAPLALFGSIISTYHYQLERFPSQATPSCGIGEPVCSNAYFNELGFISIAYMALSAFLLIATLLLMAREQEEGSEGSEEQAAMVVERVETSRRPVGRTGARP